MADQAVAGRNVFALGSVTKDPRNGTLGKNISPGGGHPFYVILLLTAYKSFFKKTGPPVQTGGPVHFKK
ncbi:hypothetical protein C4J81_11965 [Deltaproteobacteria bacterium Smac51]|nr:hypothetical protein C4J81_11965 [Deltaproteobacteria bacterium Smac51]